MEEQRDDQYKKIQKNYILREKVLIQGPTETCLIAFTLIFNVKLRLTHFHYQWRTTQILIIHKPVKKTDRRISILPLLSKTFGKNNSEFLQSILKRSTTFTKLLVWISTASWDSERVHCVVTNIHSDLNGGRYCFAAFLDISEGFWRINFTSCRGTVTSSFFNLPEFSCKTIYCKHRLLSHPF